MSVPNLDCMEKTELWEFWKITHFSPHKTARELFPDRPKFYVIATKDLGHYAANKSIAMDRRARGDITRALVYEKIADNVYSKLPEFAKW